MRVEENSALLLGVIMLLWQRHDLRVEPDKTNAHASVDGCYCQWCCYGGGAPVVVPTAPHTASRACPLSPEYETAAGAGLGIHDTVMEGYVWGKYISNTTSNLSLRLSESLYLELQYFSE